MHSVDGHAFRNWAACKRTHSSMLYRRRAYIYIGLYAKQTTRANPCLKDLRSTTSILKRNIQFNTNTLWAAGLPVIDGLSTSEFTVYMNKQRSTDMRAHIRGTHIDYNVYGGPGLTIYSSSLYMEMKVSMYIYTCNMYRTMVYLLNLYLDLISTMYAACTYITATKGLRIDLIIQLLCNKLP